MASVLSYYGSKCRLAAEIIAEFPPHHCFVEACGGSAAVTLAKPPSKVEVVNDIDRDLVNYYRVLRDRPEALVRLLMLTPYARTEHHDCRASFTDPSLDPVECARRYFVSACQSYSGLVGDAFSRSREKRLAVSFKNRVDQLHAVADRLRPVLVECLPALRLIEKYDHRGTLFYIDPPYLPETRTGHDRRAGKYRHEMSNDDHCALLVALNGVKGKVLLSGYESPLYRRFIGDWRVVWRKRVQQVSATNLNRRVAGYRTEVLWGNF
jgi:DNA adenine methylase